MGEGGRSRSHIDGEGEVLEDHGSVAVLEGEVAELQLTLRPPAMRFHKIRARVRIRLGLGLVKG